MDWVRWNMKTYKLGRVTRWIKPQCTISRKERLESHMKLFREIITISKKNYGAQLCTRTRKKSLDERVQKRNCKQEVVSGTQVGWFFQLHSFRYVVENYFYARKSDHLWPRQQFAREIWKQNNHLLFWICLRKTRSEKSRDYCDVIIFERLRHSKCFLSTRKQRQYFQILLLKIVFEKIPFRDSLVRWPGRDIDFFYPQLFFFIWDIFLSVTSYFYLRFISFIRDLIFYLRLLFFHPRLFFNLRLF